MTMQGADDNVKAFIKLEMDRYPGRTREQYETAVKEFFDEKERAVQEYSDWTDDANDYSACDIARNVVTVTAFGSDNTIIMSTEFQLTPDQAWFMFTGIRDKYRGDPE